MVKMSELELLKDAQLAKEIDELFDITRDISRQIMNEIFYRNLLYYLGEQYIEYFPTAKTFKRKPLPPGYPTPVANEIKDYVRSAKSGLLNQKTIPRVSPNTMEQEDRQAAALANKVLQWMDGLNDQEFADEKEKMVIMLLLNGTTFMRTYPDMDLGKWFFDERGRFMKAGEVVARAIMPLSVRLDRVGDRLSSKRWIGLQTLQAREWVEDTFKTKIDGPASADLVDYERKMMRLVSQVSAWKGSGLNVQQYDEDNDMVLLREIEFRPTQKFPQGRYIVCCQGKTLLEAKRLPIASDRDSWFYTLVDFHWDYVPGRFWSEAPVSDLISPQNSINNILQLLALNRKGIGRPRLLSPSDVAISKIGDGGHGLMLLKYDALLAGGKEPVIHQGIPLPQQVLEEYEMHKTSIQDMSGDPKNVLRGQPPSAQSSGIQVDILRETAERAHYPDIDRYNRKMAKVYKHRLLLAGEVYSDKRQAKIAGRGRRVEIFSFRGADLKHNTDVTMQNDSGLSTTRAGQTQILMDLADKGYLGPIAEDPSVREEFLDRVGIAQTSAQNNVDVERAEDENAAVVIDHVENLFLAEPGQVDPLTGAQGEPTVVNDDPLFKYDDHAVHFQVHRRFILSPEFEDLPLKAKTIMFAHADIHESMMQQAQAAAAEQAAIEQQNAGAGKGNGKKAQVSQTGPGGRRMPMTEGKIAQPSRAVS